MKLKNILAGVAAAAMAVSAIPAVSASALTAGATSLDFEDGDSSFVYMNLDDKGEATISVESYNGSNQLKIAPKNCDKYSKIWFDLDKIMDREKAVEIGSIDFDCTIAPVDESGSIGGWLGGIIGSAGGFELGAPGDQGQKNPGWSQSTFDFTFNYNELGSVSGPATGHGTKKFLLPTQKYSMDGTNPFFGVMINPGDGSGRTTDYVIYIDNVVFKDGSGNAIAVGVTAAAAAAEETEAAEAETEAVTEAAPVAETEAAAPVADEDVAVDDVDVDDDVDEAPVAVAETEAAPVATEAPATTAAPVAASTAPATGNVAVASIVAVMAAAGAAALVSKKRK